MWVVLPCYHSKLNLKISTIVLCPICCCLFAISIFTTFAMLTSFSCLKSLYDVVRYIIDYIHKYAHRPDTLGTKSMHTPPIICKYVHEIPRNISRFHYCLHYVLFVANDKIQYVWWCDLRCWAQMEVLLDPPDLYHSSLVCISVYFYLPHVDQTLQQNLQRWVVSLCQITTYYISLLSVNRVSVRNAV